MAVHMLSIRKYFSMIVYCIIHLFNNMQFPEYATAIILGNETDALSLLALKSEIAEDPLGALASWNSSVNFCKWTGVTCGLKHQRVTSLNLQGLKLSGTISHHVGNLSFLRYLDLSDNYFQGGISPAIGSLMRLQNLNMSFNFLGGPIPVNLSHCSSLTVLALDHNYLVGRIPFELGSLLNLRQLYLGNNLTETIPASIGNLTSLRVLYLPYNNLEGEVPDTISQLKDLATLGLSDNHLSGEFPPAFYNMSSLRFLALTDNNFMGNLRPSIGLSLPNLDRIYLAANFFTGPIPDSFSNASNLIQLELLGNQFTGQVPLSFGNLHNIQWINVGFNHLGSGQPDDLKFISTLTNCSNLLYLHFGDNQFGGILPSSIANLSTQMTRLYFENNSISGSLPKEIANLINLNTLYVSGNHLTGVIPDSIGRLSNLGTLVLSLNQFTGEIPSSIGNNTKLISLYMDNNRLEGSIPLTLGNCTQMQVLDLSRNNLSGTIPKQLMQVSTLSSVSFSYNSLTGPLPADIGNLSHLVGADFSFNRFSGEIPISMGKLLAIVILYMQNSSLQGTIPYLGDLLALQYLDLSCNNLSGQVPLFLMNLSSLVYLNLSFNSLEGKIPTEGVFANASVVEVLGNSKLCGGIEEMHLPTCLAQDPRRVHKKHSISLKLILILVGVASLIFLSLLLFSAYKIKNFKIRLSHVSSTSIEIYPNISYRLLHDATDGFSSENLIGSGSFGTVYKGNLSPDDTVVAVKVLHLHQPGASKSFMAECQALRNIRHRNLVKVITACSSSDFKGNDFKALVYPFMPNGSLDEWLHPEFQGQENSLNILQRLNIVIDVSSALNYLHHQCQTPVVHCDLKPSNVLLDSNLTARVGDFGLTRLLSVSSIEANSNQFSSLGIKGTIGYAAPEYGMGAQVSTLGDVYSFGIILLEIFTGKRPTDELFQGNLNLHQFVKKAIPDQVMEIVERSALSDVTATEFTTKNKGQSSLRSQQMDCLASIFQTGVACSEESPQDRLQIREVHSRLILMRDKFLQTEHTEVHIQSVK